MADEIHKMLALSTGHLTRATAQSIETDSISDVLHYHAKADMGWFVAVPEENGPHLPEEFGGIFDYARAQGVTWLMFDRDAAHIDGLASWKW